MINTYIKKKVPVIQACQWNGENVEEMDSFLNGSGYCKGRYVEIGCLDKYQKPSLIIVHVGSYVLKHETGEFDALPADKFFEKYILSD